MQDAASRLKQAENDKLLSIQQSEHNDLNVVFQSLGGGSVDANALMAAIKNGEGLANIVRVDAQLEKVLYQFAYQTLHLNRRSLAERQFQALCLLNNENAEYWLGLALSHAKWPQGGIWVERVLQRAKTLAPENPAVRLRLAEHFLWSKNVLEADVELNEFNRLMETHNGPALEDFAKRLTYAIEVQKNSSVVGD
ncbi:hypothetical protein [Pseudovibrio sp. Tun.PSC04-5.I4]|uniref:hypothetical protein n=1 Tax=Pseudovibrio sp. Tun.PSC04-5.I4 TaxID=1798213 RepID=UPI0008842110|nr:hypothetical protein [Pseudovibrio sp. Tun.PSC04-5.I4]SDR14997.1 hypothetical protein SAMN04515695_3028 [Pseudovibrio sp. Tun.PSC04-5.I4]